MQGAWQGRGRAKEDGVGEAAQEGIRGEEGTRGRRRTEEGVGLHLLLLILHLT